jgi:hypothetical protein
MTTTQPTTLDAEFRDVIDKQRLHDLVARLHRGLDRLDDELIVSSLAPGFRYGVRVGMTPQEFADNTRRMHTEDFVGTGLRLQFTQHTIVNELFEVDGDTAYGEIYSRFYGVVEDGSVLTVIQRYVDRYIRTADGWRLHERDPIFEWASPELADYMARMNPSRRDRSDLSYRRLDDR